MPEPRRFCSAPGCGELVAHGRCLRHRQHYERQRGSRHQRGYTNRWAQYSRARLARHPWCVGFPEGAHGTERVLADVTDHIHSARSHPELFWTESNHASLCRACNTRKAIQLEGGFGR